MVEKIIVSRDEVLHYPWLDNTWVYIYFSKNSVTKNSFFPYFLNMILKRGISEVLGKKFEDILIGDDYVFIKYDTDEIMGILKGACTWILNRNLKPKDATTPSGVFFTENKEAFASFWGETKKIFEEKTYKYYYQCIDGMN